MGLSLEKEKKISRWLLNGTLPPSHSGLLSITVAGTGDTWPQGQGRGSCPPGVKGCARPAPAAEGVVLGPPPPHPPMPEVLRCNLLSLLEAMTSFGGQRPDPRGVLGSSSGFCRARPVACSS